MTASVGKLRAIGVLLILAAGILFATTWLAAADGGSRPHVDGPARHAAEQLMPDGKACEILSDPGSCSDCCHDMIGTVCCGHLSALGTEAYILPFDTRDHAGGSWVSVTLHGADPEVAKRPPRTVA